MISTRFKSLFSDINNDNYIHYFKMSKKIRNTWDNVSHDILWIKNVCDGCKVTRNSGGSSNMCYCASKENVPVESLSGKTDGGVNSKADVPVKSSSAKIDVVV